VPQARASKSRGQRQSSSLGEDPLSRRGKRGPKTTSLGQRSSFREERGHRAQEYRRAIEGIRRRHHCKGEDFHLSNEEEEEVTIPQMKKTRSEDEDAFFVTDDEEERGQGDDKIASEVKEDEEAPLVRSSLKIDAAVHRNVSNQTIFAQEISVATVKFTVLISGVPLVVPIAPTDSIKQLAEAAADRYAGDHGAKPTLALLSSDGGRLHENDIASVVLAADSEVHSKVFSMVVLPLIDRYLAAFSAASRGQQDILQPPSDLMEKLRLADDKNGPGVLTLPWWALGTSQLAPVFTALSQQTSLKVLDLRGNRLGDSGVADLCQRALAKKNCLRTLNLSNNELSKDCLPYLVNVASSGSLNSLVTLDLSYNYFGDSSLETVKVLLTVLPALRSLGLASCGLNATFAECDIDLFSKVTIDVQYQ